MGHKSIGADYQATLNCVSKSFEQTSINAYKNDNFILRENAELWKEYGTSYWPSMTIDNLTFRGDLTPPNILEAICAALADKPEVCVKFYEEEGISFSRPEVISEYQAQVSPVSSELLGFVVVVLVLVNLALIYAYRQCAKKEMEQDMQFQVSSAVSQYIALSHQKTDNSIEMA
jgi:hypothetical protein